MLEKEIELNPLVPLPPFRPNPFPFSFPWHGPMNQENVDETSAEKERQGDAGHLLSLPLLIDLLPPLPFTWYRLRCRIAVEGFRGKTRWFPLVIYLLSFPSYDDLSSSFPPLSPFLAPSIFKFNSLMIGAALLNSLYFFFFFPPPPV